MYRVEVLVSDGAPGLLRFMWVIPAKDRVAARSVVRKRMRARGSIVRHFIAIRRLH